MINVLFHSHTCMVVVVVVVVVVVTAHCFCSSLVGGRSARCWLRNLNGPALLADVTSRTPLVIGYRARRSSAVAKEPRRVQLQRSRVGEPSRAEQSRTEPRQPDCGDGEEDEEEGEEEEEEEEALSLHTKRESPARQACFIYFDTSAD
ncbi:hypothetical protein F2P81_014716 [Scophthalmus maximus]|uniref:Uncharacterized protein n=1 Tax=Scophthalmus maximus TaxID=52904 RepID=A0A6A4SB58_SCOMX|nr:hypothetical protein F2P81_014716 [Scophthalmus maximus]